ncbi:phenylalanine--tRNA ligase subunit alpha [archaeon SCG-AAA382B04]|nr:phenylalanine--tRNA ligase subunit alpha [archaeon SCG-AAA382B04]
MALRTHEIEVLKKLREIKKATPKKLAKKTNYSKEGVLAASQSLSEKGLVNVSEEIEKKYVIQEEGKKLIKKGFPEQKVLKEVKKGNKNISKLQTKLGKEKVSIGIGWIKRKNLGEIKTGKIELTDKGKEFDIEQTDQYRLLNLLEQKPRKPEEIKNKLKNIEAIKELKNRNNAIDVIENKKRFLEITKKGKNTKLGQKERITELTSKDIRTGRWKKKELIDYDINVSAKKKFPGKKHPYQKLLDEMREIFQNMGFKEIKGNSVESSFWNFDALFQPQDHPAREMQDTFYISEPNKAELPTSELVNKIKNIHEKGGEVESEGWGGAWSEEKAKKVVLRTHTTATTIRYLSENNKPPEKVFSIDRAYRRETIDATHLPQFYQLEGIVLGEEVSFNNLLGYLSTFYEKMGFEEIRFRPGYFPYTEPSVEPEVYVEELGEWVELGGAGIFRKEVTAPFDVEGKVLAWGLGIGRLAMLKLGLNDLRELFQSDIDWLRRFPSCQL